MSRFVYIVFAALLASACTSIGYTPAEMKPKGNVYTFVDKNALTNNVRIGAVTLSDQMPKYGYIVKDDLLKETLSQSFDEAKWLNKNGKARYTLNTYFIKHEVPFSIINTKVISVVRYKLHDNVKDTDVYNNTVTIPCVITTADIYNDAERLIAATSCSVGENITHLIRELNNQF